LSAAKGEPTQPMTKTFSFKVVQSSDGGLQLEQVDSQQQQSGHSGHSGHSGQVDFNISSGGASVLQKKCANCHNASNAKGGLDITGPLTAEDVQAIQNRSLTDDESIRMPRKPDGTVAP